MEITQQVAVAGPLISQDLPEDWDDVKLLRASVLKSNQGPDWADWGFKQQLDWD
jgi:hypothetical protein